MWACRSSIHVRHTGETLVHSCSGALGSSGILHGTTRPAAAKPKRSSNDVDVATLASLLKQSKTLTWGRRAHDHIIQQHRYDNNTFLANFLIEMYGHFGSLPDARAVFDYMPKPNLHSWNILIKVYGQNASVHNASHAFSIMPCRDVVSWTAMITVFSQHGYGKEALNLFFQMLLQGITPNKITFVCSLEACTSLSSLIEGRDIHIAIVKYGYEQDAVVGTVLVIMYGKCGHLQDATKVFGSLTDRDVASWNAVITSLSRNGEDKEALNSFRKMQLEGLNPDYVSFVCVLDACRSLSEGLDIHAVIVRLGLEQDVVVYNTLINMYGKYCSLMDALAVFSKMPYRTAVSWNALITAFSENVHGKQALQFFCQMQIEGFMLDKVTFLGALSACTSLATLEVGHEVHSTLIERSYGLDLPIGNAIITMYGWCGSLDDAKNVFDKMSNRDSVTWSSMIAVYCHASQGEEALDLFYLMHPEGLKPNKAIFVSVLDACGILGAHEQGLKVHAYIVDMGIDKDVVVGNALVNLYGKCGSLLDARSVFDKMDEQDAISWTGMIAGFAHSGCSKEALDFFCQMQLEGWKPDKATFMCILSACNHDGQVDLSKHLFVSMIGDYCIPDNKDHFLCMIDLLGRSGHLDEAESLIKRAPAESVSAAWLCLLGACKIHFDVERGAHAASQFLKLEPNSPAPYIMLSNIYAVAGRWDDVAIIREASKSISMRKELT